ncbi:hypothetical protein ACJJTC_006600 [Scirpophaga incertulas]
MEPRSARRQSSVRGVAQLTMVNYKRVVCEVAVLATVLAVAATAPADCHYDQRQNGTENYRLNIDGVVIAVAPADSLLAAASDIDISDLLDLDEFNEPSKPKPPSDTLKPHIEPKPEDPKPVESKPDAPGKPEKPAETPLSDVSLNSEPKGQKKDASTKKQEKAQRYSSRVK